MQRPGKTTLGIDARAAIFGLALFTAVPPAAADWTPLGPSGGMPRRFEAMPQGAAYRQLVATTSTLFAQAPAGTWSAIGPYYGGGHHVLPDLIVAPSDPQRILLIALDPYTLETTIHRTEDGGASWDTLPQPPLPPGATSCYCVAYHPTDPAMIFLGSYGSLWRTTDDGLTWQRISGGLPDFVIPTDLLFLPGATPVLLLGSRGNFPGIFRSEDLGESWTHVFSGAHIGKLLVAPDDPLELYALYQGDPFHPPPPELYRSLDGGLSWQLRSADARLAQQYAIDPATPDRHYAIGSTAPDTANDLLLMSTDRGQSWTEIADAGQLGVGTLYGVDALPAPGGGSELYVGTNIRGVWRTDDLGATWTIEDCVGTRVGALAVDPLVPGRVYLGTADAPYLTHTNGLFYTSGDGGLTWSGPSASDQPLGRIHVIVPSRHQAGKVWVGSDYGLFLSQDAGATLAKRGGGVVRGIWEDPADSAHLFYAWTGGLVPGRPHFIPGLAESHDAGASWALVDSLDYPVNGLTVDPDDGRVYCALDGTLIWSDDGGATWVEWNAGVNLDVTGLDIDPQDSWTLSASTRGSGIFTSHDRGASWQPTNAGLGDLDVRGLVRAESGRLVAATAGGCYSWTGSGWAFESDGLVQFPSPGDSTALNTLAAAFDPATGRLYAGSAGRGAYAHDGPLSTGARGRRPGAAIASVVLSNHPNPFRPTTQIRFALPEGLAATPLRLRIYDVRGRVVAAPWAGVAGAGVHELRWDGRDAAGRPLPAGVYFAELRGAGVRVSRRMHLVR